MGSKGHNCGHVAYQIKGNEEYSNMVANILPAAPPPPPPLPDPGGQSLPEHVSLLHIKLKRILNTTTL